MSLRLVLVGERGGGEGGGVSMRGTMTKSLGGGQFWCYFSIFRVLVKC